MRVLVAGDVVTDHYIFEGRTRHVGSTVLDGAKLCAEQGGAGLVGRLLKATANRRAGGAATVGGPRFDVELGFSDTSTGFAGRVGVCVLQPCERWRDDKVSVWRISMPLGFAAQAASATQAISSNTLETPADFAVLDDAGLEFRRSPNQHAWPRFLREPGQALPTWIVLKSSGSVATGDLWHTIVSGHTQANSGPDGLPVSLGDLAGRTVVVLSLDDLRREFARVDGRLSWERLAIDLVQELNENPRLQALKRVRVVVVRIGLDGAVIVERDTGTPHCTLVFDTAGVEGAFVAGVPSGTVIGYQSCLTTAIVSTLVDWTANPGAFPSQTACLISGAKAGLRAARRLILDGYEYQTPTLSFPCDVVAEEIDRADPKWSFASVTVPFDLPRSSQWTIIADGGGHVPGPLWGLARRVAIRGTKELADVPYLKFAKLLAVDRSEVESLRTLQRLLTAYRDDRKATKPLSIAAFGPPGAGKSFGVKQLAEAVFGDKNPLEFNLAQFTRPEELHGLFHQVRDRVLQGQLPIVFWDEFDSRNLFWLQDPLGPMQDGTFQDGQVTHPIGRCVFVFAGGTRERFEDFGEPPAELQLEGVEKDLEASRAEFKALKGPDFKSRLSGYINVLGPNCRDADDVTYPVRRALLLRVHLGIASNEPAAIDPGLLNGFLRIYKYRHGSRSLEKIAEQVRQSARAGAFNRSDLPPRQIINLYADVDEFLELVERL